MKKCRKLLFVEDGSVDLDELKKGLPEDIKIVVYRSGALRPEIVSLDKKAQRRRV